MEFYLRNFYNRSLAGKIFHVYFVQSKPPIVLPKFTIMHWKNSNEFPIELCEKLIN